jgi:hypothetical protein
VRTIKIAIVRDHRVGVSLDLYGVATAKSKSWQIRYAGQYGFAGDPRPHVEGFERLSDAMVRWEELMKDYHSRVLGVNRLKAFKKSWVKLTPGQGMFLEEEAVIWQKDVVVATMSSQGPKTRRKRTWVFVVAWMPKDIADLSITKLIVPASIARGPLPETSEAVPISEIPKRLNELWGATIKMYRSVI